MVLGTDGSRAELIQLNPSATGSVELRLQGQALGARAIGAMENAVRELAQRHRLVVADLTVVVHGGNGRLPELLARRLDLPSERVWSETPRTGNLGSASLPVAWAAHNDIPLGPIIWTAVGAGLTWGAALLRRQPESPNN